MTEKRQFQRRPVREAITFSVSVYDGFGQTRLDLTAMTFDAGAAGLGIETDYPLEPGHIIRLDTGDGRKVGVVKWCKKSGHSYRAGISLRALEATKAK